MKKLLFPLLLLLVAFPLHAQKRAFQLADLYKLKGVSDPRVSPDGKLIAFVVTEYTLEKGKANAEVYVMNANGEELKNVSDHSSADNHPFWSPDGKTLYFTSSRENGPQVWKIAPAGGTPERVTNFSMGAAGAELSPDGRSLLFSADVFEDCGADDACNKYSDSTLSNGPVQAYMADGLLYRHWTDWKRGKVAHTIRFDMVTGAYTDLTPGAYDWPAWEQGGVGIRLVPRRPGSLPRFEPRRRPGGVDEQGRLADALHRRRAEEYHRGQQGLRRQPPVFTRRQVHRLQAPDGARI